MKVKDTTAIQVAFGKHLKKVRIKKKISQRQLSFNCDLDNSFIAKVEKGQFNIQLGTIVELAKGLNIHPKELLDVEFE